MSKSGEKVRYHMPNAQKRLMRIRGVCDSTGIRVSIRQVEPNRRLDSGTIIRWTLHGTGARVMNALRREMQGTTTASTRNVILKTSHGLTVAKGGAIVGSCKDRFHPLF
jgi:hypothetical protein